MKNQRARIQPFLIIVVSFLLVFYPAYFNYNALIEVDSLSPNPSFENSDQEDLLADEPGIGGLGFFPTISSSSRFSIQQFPLLSFPVTFSDQLISLLRC
jgi:hypothetical protein